MSPETVVRTRPTHSFGVVERRGAERRAAHYLTAARVSGRSSFTVPVLVLVLLIAAGADVAAFYDVLANHTNSPDLVLYVLVAGFAVGPLWLAHTVGATLRDRVDGAPDYQPVVLWTAAAGWLLIGTGAFFARLLLTGAAPSSSFGTAAPYTVDGRAGLVMALLFATLYIGTGILAAGASFTLHNSIERAVGTASRRIRGLRKRLSRHERTHERIAAELRRLQAERVRLEQAHEAARLRAIALGDELKQYVRMRIAQTLDEPSATDAMFEPDRYPFTGTPLRSRHVSLEKGLL